ncbi:MAG TPA: LLM class flavin-dependent oxidoreductase [Stellaceae bacterium]|nr:LLM class flavin-dependent oxidoreductase [Stellaceae bacterium]
MHFGLQFFPDAGPDEKSAQDYWNESLHLVRLCDAPGFSHIRTVEHYFDRYGGYSPNPIVFLSAASQRSAKARLVTMSGTFRSLEDVTSLPRPVRQPRSAIWVASTSSPQSFVNAGRNGYWLMSIPRDAKQLNEPVALYRQGWRDAGHTGDG